MKSVFAFNARQNPDIPKLIAYYRELGGVYAHLQQCYDTDVANQIRPFLEVADVVVWRQHSDETLYRRFDPEVFAVRCMNALKAANIPIERIYLHGHNEAGIGKEVLDWELAFGKKALALGFGGVVLLNCNPGTPEKEDWKDCEQLVRWLGENRKRAKLGLHEYFPILFSKGKGHLIGRFNWLLEWIGKTNSTIVSVSNLIKNPAIFITEFGSDWVDGDWQINFQTPPGYHWARGYKSLSKAYEKLLDKPLAEAYFLQFKQAHEEVYKDSVVEVIFFYNWNAQDGKYGSGREEEMDLSDDDAGNFRNALRDWWKTMQPTPVVIDQRPQKSEFDNQQPMLTELVDGRVRLRKGPSTDYETLLMIGNGDIVRVIHDFTKWGAWAAIYLQNELILEDKRIGFVHTDWIRFHSGNAPDEQPLEPVEDDRVAWQSYFTDIELQQIAYALAYSGNFPEIGSHLKKLIAKMVSVYEQLP